MSATSCARRRLILDVRQEHLDPMLRLSRVHFTSPIVAAIILACFFDRLLATADYDYGADEYVTITKGFSPDGRFAISAHKGYGLENFHFYLTDAVTGRCIGSLEEVDPTLDTAADAFGAIWSKDSSSVTLVWRWSRHDPFKSITYRIFPKGASPKTKKAIDLDADSKLIDFWSKNCSGDSPTEKRFETAKIKPKN